MEKPEQTLLSNNATRSGVQRIQLYGDVQIYHSDSTRRVVLRRGPASNAINVWEEELDDTITYLLYVKKYLEEQNAKTG